MRVLCWGIAIWAGVGFGLLTGFSVSGQPDPNGRCLLECHGKPDFKKAIAPGQYRTLYLDYSQFKLSVHKKKTCTECHTDVTVLPHPKNPDSIHCLQCHYEGNVVGAPVSERPEKYKESAHGQAYAQGDPNAPDCQSCHTVHSVKPPQDPLSSVHRSQIAKTCGSCHLEVYAEYLESVHGQALRRDELDSAVCTDCHSEHDIYPADDPRSSFNARNVAGTCSRCHGDVQVMERRGMKATQVEAFKESFHGIKIEFGVIKSANCVSCHSYHKILLSSDPRSPIHPQHLAQTCGQCHPNATSNVAMGKFHIIASDPEAGIVFYISQFFKWLTISVLAGLIIHIMLDLYGRFRLKKAGGG
jgi:hypothetical protein